MNSFKMALVLAACLILTQVSALACSGHGPDNAASHTEGDKPANG